MVSSDCFQQVGKRSLMLYSIGIVLHAALVWKIYSQGIQIAQLSSKHPQHIREFEKRIPEIVQIPHGLRLPKILRESYNGPIQKIEVTSTTVGLPGKNYLNRAKNVLDFRASAWTTALKEGTPCNEKMERCDLGLICQGPKGYKHCVLPSKIGAKCDEIFRPCGPESICILGTCRVFQKRFSFCSKEYKCKKHLRCIDSKCVSAIKPGGECGDEKNICVRGFICDLWNSKRCVSVGRLGSTCSDHFHCHIRYYCRDGKCVKRKIQGKRCVDHRECAINRLCKNSICRRQFWNRAQFGKYCAPFDQQGPTCRKGLICLNKGGRNNCVLPSGKAVKCNPWRPCPENDLCFEGVCYKRLLWGESCNDGRRSFCSSQGSCKNLRGARAQLCTKKQQIISISVSSVKGDVNAN